MTFIPNRKKEEMHFFYMSSKDFVVIQFQMKITLMQHQVKVPLAIGCFLDTNFKDQAVSGRPDAINSQNLEIPAERNPHQNIKEMSQICVCFFNNKAPKQENRQGEESR